MLDDWLTVGPYSSLLHTSAQQPRKTRLLGADIEVWRDAQGLAMAMMDGQALSIRTEYGYLWVLSERQAFKALVHLA